MTIKASFPFKMITMPDGAPHCVLDEAHDYYDEYDGCYNAIHASITSFNDIGELLALHNACKYNHIQINALNIFYIPCRQDRREENTSFTVKIYADIINSLNIPLINLYHPHSSVMPALLNNCEVIDMGWLYAQAIGDYNIDALIIPDAGASKLGDLLNIRKFQCLKHRNPSDGRLTEIKLGFDKKELEGLRLMIIDDIIDGGATFINIAKELGIPKDNLFLCATHGIFSKGYTELAKYFSKIITTNSFREKPDFCVEVADSSSIVDMREL